MGAKVTIAKAAELAGLNIYEFIKACKDNQVAVIDISRDELLEELRGGWLLNDFGAVIVPETVFHEATNSDKSEAETLRIYLKGKVRQVDMRGYVYLGGFVDAGAIEASSKFMLISYLIDDKRGRKAAKINNISTIGSLWLK